jgi:hypothetical protein
VEPTPSSSWCCPVRPFGSDRYKTARSRSSRLTRLTRGRPARPTQPSVRPRWRRRHLTRGRPRPSCAVRTWPVREMLRDSERATHGEAQSRTGSRRASHRAGGRPVCPGSATVPSNRCFFSSRRPVPMRSGQAPRGACRHASQPGRDSDREHRCPEQGRIPVPGRRPHRPMTLVQLRSRSASSLRPAEHQHQGKRARMATFMIIGYGDRAGCKATAQAVRDA